MKWETPARSSGSSRDPAPTQNPSEIERTLLALLARRSFLRPLDELLRHDEAAVLVLGHELEANASPLLVHLLHDHVDDVAAPHHVLDVRDPARADVGDVEQAVGALLQLDEGAELRRLDDPAGVR